MGVLKVSTAVRRVIRSARGNEWSTSDELTAVLAVRLAKQLDDAVGTADVVRLTREIRTLLGSLPGATPAPPEDEGSADDDDEPTALDRELAAIVGAGPSLGYTQDT